MTAGTRLATAVQVGLAAGKGLALALDKPLNGVHHLAAHAAVEELAHGPLPERAVALIVSGAHTSLPLLGDLATGPAMHLVDTVDYAAGEAFDKVARGARLGYPGPSDRPSSAAQRPCGAETRRRSPSRGRYAPARPAGIELRNPSPRCAPTTGR